MESVWEIEGEFTAAALKKVEASAGESEGGELEGRDLIDKWEGTGLSGHLRALNVRRRSESRVSI